MKKQKGQFQEFVTAKQRIREQMQGFSRLNDLVRQERIGNLPKLSAKESKAIYEGLWKMWAHCRKKYPDYRKLDTLRIRELVKRRKLWDRIAKGLNDLTI